LDERVASLMPTLKLVLIGGLQEPGHGAGSTLLRGHSNRSRILKRNACAPDVLVKGGDYTAEATAGAAEVVASGGRFVAIPFESAHSTTALLKRIRG